ncbi:MAG: hypothetical protein HYV13_02515 [Candidatus Doudnabacteria bacterium]|nr:hypothetical protein [Candidatus Doudnabacteria bacterium]
MFWRRFAWQLVVLVAGVLILSLIFWAGLVSAQEQEFTADVPVVENVPVASDQPVVSEEVKAEVEADLAPSADAAKESSVDLKAELDLPADFDPVVPNNFFNSVRYAGKKFGRNLKEGFYNTFASEESQAQLIKNHADMELVEATKLANLDPGSGKVIDILDKYQSHVEQAKDKIEGIKNEDPGFAKEFSAELAEDSLFVAPKVFDNMQDALLNANPGAVPQILRFKDEVLAAGGESVVAAASNETEAAETFKIIAQKNFKTPFSGLAAADIFAQTQQNLPNLSSGFHGVFDQVISTSLSTVQENLQNLDVDDEAKAVIFQKYVEQLPGQSVSRMKMVDQFKGQADLPPFMIAKMQEIKARLAENLSERIESVVDAEVRKAMTEGLMQFKNPSIQDFKVLSEAADLMPSNEIRQQIAKKHDEGVQKFLTKFGDDANARTVTEEFQAITKKVQSGEIMPDANFFKTLDGLKQKLSPDQQQFINEMEQTGRNEMASRFKDDPAFAQRFATFNPADTAILDQVKQQFDPSQIPNFNQKFAEIEKNQAENFRKFLDVQNNFENVRKLETRFQAEVPEEVKQKFERSYQFDFATDFAKQAEKTQQKEQFFQQKRQEMEQQFREKFGEEFPGQGQGSFPGQPGFGFPGQGFGVGGTPSAFQADQNITCPAGTSKSEFGCEVPFEKSQFDPSAFCTQKGGNWTGTFCEFKNQNQQGGGFEGRGEGSQPQQRGDRPESNFPSGSGTQLQPPDERPSQAFPETTRPSNRIPQPGEFTRPTEPNFQQPTGEFKPPTSEQPSFQQPPSFQPPSDILKPPENFQPPATFPDTNQ